MILLVDIGNTHTCIGVSDKSRIANLARISSDIRRTEYEYAISLKEIFSLNGFSVEDLRGAIISSVVPPLTDVISRAVSLISKVNPMIVGSGLKTGLDIRIDDPRQLGSDLVIGAVAALQYYDLPAVVIDLGTATTFSVIDGKGIYRGGAILSGIGTSLSALSEKTSQLPDIQLEAPAKCIGTNTIDCMKSGAVFGSAAMIDGMILRIEKELGTTVKAIATGGLAEKIVPFCEHPIISDSDLLLKGLLAVYLKNCPQKNN